MNTKTSTSIELARAKSSARCWQIARVVIGVILCVAGFIATIGAVMGVAAAAYIADGGAPNGGRALLLLGMIVACSMGLLPALVWTFSGSAENRASACWSGLLVAGLCLVGCALGHCFGDAFWSTWSMDWLVGGTALCTAAITLFAAFAVVPRAEAAEKRFYQLDR